MSKDIIAENCANLCFAGLALAAGTATMSAFIVPIAALGGYLLDIRGKCDRRMVRNSVVAALKALEGADDLTKFDLTTASAWLQSRRSDLRLDPAKLAKAAQTGDLPQALFDQFDDGTLARDGGARRVVLMALTAAYNTCRGHENFHTIFTQDVLIALAKDHRVVIEMLGSIKDDTTTIIGQHAATQETLARLMQLIQARQPDDFAKHRELILGIAGTYAKNPDGSAITDIDAALTNIRAALIEYQKMQQEGALPRNAAGHLDAVLARVNALNQRGQIASAGDELARARAALRDDIAEKAAGMIRLLDTSIAQTRLQNQPEEAAALLVERLDLERPSDGFDALRQIFNEWYKRGQRQGIAFDLETAIHLAIKLMSRAKDGIDDVQSLNDLGVALWTKGARDLNDDNVQFSIQVFQQALLAFTPETAPSAWADTQNNLGDALCELARRKVGKDAVNLLIRSIKAYRSALTVKNLQFAPLSWALTQNNLAAALNMLAGRLDDKKAEKLLVESIAALRSALKEFRQDIVPLNWADTQTNLGSSLRDLANLTTGLKGKKLLEQAVEAYRKALIEKKREIAPIDWALAQNNLGVALTDLGRRTMGAKGMALLAEAVLALSTAQLERTRDALPFQWAITQDHLAFAEIAFFDKNSDPTHLNSARTYVMSAREVFEQASAQHQLAVNSKVLASIELRLLRLKH